MGRLHTGASLKVTALLRSCFDVKTIAEITRWPGPEQRVVTRVVPKEQQRRGDWKKESRESVSSQAHGLGNSLITGHHSTA